METRQKFTSRLATILTMVGVAVGLGNVWRFPYMMGKYGGSAFLIVFLFFALVFAIPAVMGEWALGRTTRQGPPGAFVAIWGSTGGRIAGTLLLFTVFVAESYYMLVIAYLTTTAILGTSIGFGPEQLTIISGHVGNGWQQFGVALVLMTLTVLVVLRGLRGGIEKLSVFIVPVFGIIVVILIGYTLSLEGALDQLAAFLKPDFSEITKPTNLFAAMGQAIFSLSLGGTFFVIYGSYLRDDEDLRISALWTGLGDVGAALLASLFLVPAILVFGLELGQGPGLVLETLPRLFGEMPYGRVVGSFFLFGLVLIAFLSSLAAVQVVVGAVVDFWKIPLKKAAIVVGVAEMALLLPVALNPEWIGRLDLFFGSGMQCVGCILALLALTWGLGSQGAKEALFGKTAEPRFANFTLFWLRWVIPGVLLLVLGMYIVEQVQ